MNCGLLGRHLQHSYSPQIHSKLGNYSYGFFEIEPEELRSFLSSNVYDGLNVTIPYKKAVIPYCSKLSPQAEALGSVNTIVRRSDGSLYGHNTDYFGFASVLAVSDISVSGKKVLILGSGGASLTCQAVLQSEGADIIVISRHGENNYSNLHLHKDVSLIVNATPVGMYPNNGSSPVDLSLFPSLEGVIDLIYNPARTNLLLQAEALGLKAINGLWMLVAQAKESAEWFTGNKIDDALIPRIYNHLKTQMENIVLIGMPGCGKTTIGTILAEKCGREYVDTDAVITQKTGKTIPQIFAEVGEVGFRKLETEVLSEVSKCSGLVISTGGGCVTNPENYPLLHQNSKIFWLKRDISLLPTDGRPLSAVGKLEEMYRVREPLYMAFADEIIDNVSTPEETANIILGGF